MNAVMLASDLGTRLLDDTSELTEARHAIHAPRRVCA